MKACMPSRYPSLTTKTRSLAHNEYSALRRQGYIPDIIPSYVLFKYPASARTVATPLRFRVPSASPAILNQDALRSMASVPEARGDSSTAYALVPFIVFAARVRMRGGLNMQRTYSIYSVE